MSALTGSQGSNVAEIVKLVEESKILAKKQKVSELEFAKWI